MLKTLKVDCSYKPISIISAIAAFGLVFTNRANIVEIYDNTYFRTPTDSFEVPNVISINRFVPFLEGLKCNRKNIFKRDKNTCQYCSYKGHSSEMTLDHIVPKSQGGKIIWSNIVTCCYSCNQRKGNKTLSQANVCLKTIPTSPSLRECLFINNPHIQPKWKIYLHAYGYKYD
jgi:5-methylcytosine-specific restriction endonuclease McrA